MIGRAERTPELWVLGSSDYGAQLAAAFGLPYAFAYFFTDGDGAERALSLYRRLYQPSERHPTPQATVCVWALVADTEADACHHALSRERWRVDRQRGRLGPLQPPDRIAQQGFTEEDMAIVAPMRAKAFVGTASQVRDDLSRLAAALGGMDELVVNTWAHDPQVRRHSYALLANAFDLRGPGTAP
jgi:luciferase family oxidoreductase group 1